MPPPDHLNLSYLASFPNGSLEPSVDKLGLGSMQIGHTDVADINPTAIPQDGTYRLEVTNPSPSFKETYSGLFVTPVDFGTGTLFSARASFIGPVGPLPGAGVLWAIALMVRSGGAVASINEPRAGVTLQVREGGIRLNVPGAEPALDLDYMEQDRLDAIFDSDNPAPITLELLVDRITGTGNASVRIGDFPEESHAYNFKVFKTDSGPTITAVGPAIAVASPAGTTASVRVRDFRLSVARS